MTSTAPDTAPTSPGPRPWLGRWRGISPTPQPGPRPEEPTMTDTALPANRQLTPHNPATRRRSRP